ncbi:MAG: Slp family lipoprotein [Acidiferrobacterales bacterium]
MTLTLACIGSILLAACATNPPFDLAGVDTALMPGPATTDIGMTKGHRVEWGGVIVTAKNLRDWTDLEILAYPLDRSAHPETEKKPLGRFILRQKGYLETVDYAPGRLITAVGDIMEIKEGFVGQAPYRFPVLGAEQLHLWPKEVRTGTEPSVRIGFGFGYFN